MAPNANANYEFENTISDGLDDLLVKIKSVLATDDE
jgi:hypothetical protein